MVRRGAAGLAMVGVLVGLAGCGDTDSADQDGDTVPTTPRTLAALATEVLGIEPDSFESPAEDDGTGVGIRFDAGEGEDGDLVVLTVAEADALPACADATCDDWSAAGGDFQLAWETEAPEEDPGLLVLRHFDDGVLAEVLYAGQPITGDPREQADLELPVSRFEELLADDRLGLVAPAELADAPLPGWSDDTP